MERLERWSQSQEDVRVIVSSRKPGRGPDSSDAGVSGGGTRSRLKWVLGQPHNVVFERSHVDLGSTFYWLLTCFSISEKGIIIVTNFMVIVRLK